MYECAAGGFDLLSIIHGVHGQVKEDLKRDSPIVHQNYFSFHVGP